jgi:hypothetical protein
MIGLRGRDVHLATTGATPLPKYIEEDRYGKSPHHSSAVFYSAALFGPAPVAEQMNPDGTTVSGPILRGTIGLYLDQGGRTIEATTACREFIEQLRSLVGAMKA